MGLLEESKHFFPPPQSMGSGTLVSLCQEAICFRQDPAQRRKKLNKKKNHTLLPSVAEMLEVLIIRRLSSQSNLRPLALHHYGTLQSCIYASFQHIGIRALSLLLQLCWVSSSAQEIQFQEFLPHNKHLLHVETRSYFSSLELVLITWKLQ